MANEPIPGLVYGCVTHIPLWLDFPAFVTPIYLGQAQGEGLLNLRDLAPEWVQHHPVLGGVAGSFALRQHVLKNHPDATRIGICQYRKFISRERVVVNPDPAYPVMDAVFKGRLEGGRFAEVLNPGELDFVVSRPLPFGKWHKRTSVFQQYRGAHHAEDLIYFTDTAVKLGVLDRRGAAAFLDETVFYPGGIELGVYEAGFWLRSMAAVESVVRACLEVYPAHREGYQLRAWAFCAERLGSHLLLERFREIDGTKAWMRRVPFARRSLPTHRYLGHMNLITEREDQSYVLGSVDAAKPKPS